jgi:pyruvate-formate lyase-activating enzyme
MSDPHYREQWWQPAGRSGRHLLAHDLGIWVEVVSLIIPDFNDSKENSGYVPLFSGCFSDIPGTSLPFTDQPALEYRTHSAEILQRAADIGQKPGSITSMPAIYRARGIA